MGLFDLFRRKPQFPEISELDRTRAVWEAYLAAMVAKANGRTGPLCGETITVREVAVVPASGATNAREADGNDELLPLPVACNGMSLKPLGTIGQGRRQNARRVWYRSFKGRNPITGAKLEYWCAAL